MFSEKKKKEKQQWIAKSKKSWPIKRMSVIVSKGNRMAYGKYYLKNLNTVSFLINKMEDGKAKIWKY